MAGRAWNALFEVASTQEGLFTTEQAASAGLSRQLLRFHVERGNVRRLRRGVYRIVNYPPGDHEDLVELWLWSKQAGVFSHETALSLHGLSDVLPKRVHVTVPPAFRRRRESIPPGLSLHLGNVPDEERAWFGPVPVTEPGRTLLDCAAGHLSPDLLLQAIEQARTRGLVSAERLAKVTTTTRGGTR